MAAKDRASAWSAAIGVFGEILLTIGALILLYVLYEVYWTNIEAHQQQVQAQERLHDRWAGAQSGGAPIEGEAMAQMFIPSFGSDWRFAIIEGTSEADLLRGPGHYIDSQLPGTPGNFAVAGHRVGKGAPFNDLGLLHTCDAIVVESENKWDIYRVMPIAEGDPAARSQALTNCMQRELADRATSGPYQQVEGRIITTPGDISTIAPIPGDNHSSVSPELLPMLTLTTCHPQFSNAERMIIHAVLVESQPKIADQRPAILTHG